MNTRLLFPRLAVNGIRKNRRVYLPYILTCAGMIMIHYITAFLWSSSFVATMKGGRTMHSLLGMGCFFMAVFSAIFLFYTNSFLIRRRKTEFGLYNILGMTKRNITRILLWETAMIYAASSAVGIGCGLLFSKLAELALTKMLGGNASYTFNADPLAIVQVLIIYAVIFLLIMLNSIRQVHFTSSIELMHSENAGEKPPKANYVLAIIGAVMLIAAYALAVYIKKPMAAIQAFLAAVILVIIATYLLFISASVALCRALQKNKRYYYKTNHFVSLSQMAFRMKRNGAGLASICILSIMVLVTLSSTTCLYIGAEDMLRERYPRDIVIETYPYSTDDELVSHMYDTANSAVEKFGETPLNVLRIGYFFSREFFSGSSASSYKTTDEGESTQMDVRYLVMVSLDDYNRIMGESAVLSDGEALMYTTFSDYNFDTLTIDDFATLSIKSRVDKFPNVLPSSTSAVYLVVNDSSMIDEMYELRTKAGDCFFQPELVDYYAFDLGCDSDKKMEVLDEICARFAEESGDSPENSVGYSISCIEDDRAEFIAVYGGLFFLGILFGTVFIAAAVLIMYYKQISEGFEDKSKFTILQNVGMTPAEIRQSINSQVLTVFFAPLALAGVHMAFAFVIIYRMLVLFGLTDIGLFAVVTVSCFLIFGVMYTAVYLITSRSYYRIVSDMK